MTEYERVRKNQSGPSEGKDSAVATEKKPFEEPTPDRRSHASRLHGLGERNPSRIGRVGPHGARQGGRSDRDPMEEVGGLRPPMEIKRR